MFGLPIPSTFLFSPRDKLTFPVISQVCNWIDIMSSSLCSRFDIFGSLYIWRLLNSWKVEKQNASNGANGPQRNIYPLMHFESSRICYVRFSSGWKQVILITIYKCVSNKIKSSNCCFAQEYDCKLWLKRFFRTVYIGVDLRPLEIIKAHYC